MTCRLGRPGLRRSSGRRGPSQQPGHPGLLRHAQHAAAYVRSIAPSAQPAVRSNLKRAAALATGFNAEWDRYPWHRLDVAQLEAVRNGLRERHTPATANATIASVRGVLRRAWHAGDLDRADYERRLDALRTVPGQAAPGRVLNARQVGKLFVAASDQNPAAAARDAALLATLYGLGLRRAEAAAAQLADLDLEEWTLTVHGKGRRQRLAYLSNGSREAMQAWLDVRGLEDGSLFVPVDKSGRLQAGRGVTGRGIAKRVSKLAALAGLEAVSPHALRRSFATQLLAQGNDLAVTADLMGHARTDTTRLYDRRGEEAKKAAAATLAVPYRARRPKGPNLRS